MKFRRAVQRYGRTPEPVTPYQRAAQLWDDRIGSARVQARNWRLMAFGGLILSAGLASGLLWESTQSRVVPYVVAVDRLGEPQAIAPADRDYQPTDPQLAWFLGRFVSNVRSVSLDPVLMRQNWLSAYDFVTGAGARFLGDYARQSDPFGDIGNRTVAVQVISIVRASDRSFQVKWIEREYDRGALVGTSHWTAILSVAIRPPRTVETLRRNPLGLYVEAIDWTKELDPASATADGASSSGSRFGAGPLPPSAPLGTGTPEPPSPLAERNRS